MLGISPNSSNNNSIDSDYSSPRNISPTPTNSNSTVSSPTNENKDNPKKEEEKEEPDSEVKKPKYYTEGKTGHRRVVSNLF